MYLDHVLSHLSYMHFITNLTKREDGAILPTPMRLNPTYVRVYILWMNLFVQIVIPFLVLTILNSFIYKKIKAFEKRSRDGHSARTQLKVCFTPHISSKLSQGNNVPARRDNRSQDNGRHMLTHSVNIRRCRSVHSFLNSRESTKKNENVKRRVESPKTTQQCTLPKYLITTNNGEEKQPSFKKKYSPITVSNSYNGNINPYLLENDIQNEEITTNEKSSTISNNAATYSGNECNDDGKSRVQECRLQTNHLITNINHTKAKNGKSCQKVPKNVSIKLQTNRGNLESCKTSVVKTSSSGTSLRKREVALSKISLYIVFVMLICHGVRLIPNTYEMIETYTQVCTISSNSNTAIYIYKAIWADCIFNILSFFIASQDPNNPKPWPTWLERVMCISHFLLTVASSTNFIIYFAKHGRLSQGFLYCCGEKRNQYGATSIV